MSTRNIGVNDKIFLKMLSPDKLRLEALRLFGDKIDEHCEFERILRKHDTTCSTFMSMTFDHVVRTDPAAWKNLVTLHRQVVRRGAYSERDTFVRLLRDQEVPGVDRSMFLALAHHPLVHEINDLIVRIYAADKMSGTKAHRAGVEFEKLTQSTGLKAKTPDGRCLFEIDGMLEDGTIIECKTNAADVRAAFEQRDRIIAVLSSDVELTIDRSIFDKFMSDPYNKFVVYTHGRSIVPSKMRGKLLDIMIRERLDDIRLDDELSALIAMHDPSVLKQSPIVFVQ